MAVDFWSSIGQRLLFWSGWFFTVFGAIVGLVIAHEYAWIGAMLAVGLLLPAFAYARWAHAQLDSLDKAHAVKAAEYQDTLNKEKQLREATERQLNALPAEAMSQLLAIVAEGVRDELLASIRQQAEFVSRLKAHKLALVKPLTIRQFVLLHDVLYVLARGSADALRHLRTDDPFLLLRRNESGVEVVAANLLVHQPVEADGDVVTFRVAAVLTDDVTHLTRLAGASPVEGLKGYIVVPALDTTTIPDLKFDEVAQAIPHLAAGLKRSRSS